MAKLRFIERAYGTEVTTPPDANIMENRTPSIPQDRSSIKASAGHLYGFMILFSYASNPLDFATSLELHQAQSNIAPLEYFFTVAPQQINLLEPATVQIQPTMGRNYLVEHQGSILKQLSITGTTGFRPMSSSSLANSPVNRIFGRTLAAIEGIANTISGFGGLVNVRGIPESEITGYFNFMQLRNLFRQYVFLKSNPEHVRGPRFAIPTLVWVNFHEYEFWICEPATFTTRRESTRPLSFSYDVSCTLLKKLDATNIRPDDWFGNAQTWSTGWNAMMEMGSRLNRLLFDVSRLQDAATGDLVGLTNDVRELLTGQAASVRSILRAGRNFTYLDNFAIEQAKSVVFDVAQAWDDAFSEVTGTRSRYAHLESGNSLKEAVRVVNRLNSIKRDQQTERQGSAANYILSEEQRAYSLALSDTPTLDSTTSGRGRDPNFGEAGDLRSVSRSNSVDRTTVGIGEDLRAIALRVYGTAARWKELAQFNGLIFPYIANVATEGVLKPGDEILVPGADFVSPEFGNLVLPTSSDDLGSIENIQPEDAVFGRDIRVKFVEAPGNTVFLDIVTTPSGDIATVSGRNNFKQAMALVSNTPQGTLELHKYYGFPLLVGSKVKYSDIALWSINARRTLQSDPRVATIVDAGAGLTGDVFVAHIEVVSLRALVRVPLTAMQRV